jgi:hypothetical protein
MSLRIPFTIRITGRFAPGVREEDKEGILDEEYYGPFLAEFETHLHVAQLVKLNTLFPQLRDTFIPFTSDTSTATFGDDNTFTVIDEMHLTIPGLDTIVGYEEWAIETFNTTFEMIQELFIGPRDVDSIDFEEDAAFGGDTFVADSITIVLKSTLLDEYKKNLNIREKTYVIQGMQQLPQNVTRLVAKYAFGTPNNTIPLKHKVPEVLQSKRLYNAENLRPEVIRRRAAEAAAAAGGGGGGAQGGGRRKSRAAKTQAARMRSTRRKSATRKHKSRK